MSPRPLPPRPWAVAVVAAMSLSGCDGTFCPAGFCSDTLNVSVQLPGQPQTYTFIFTTEQRETTCVIEVPVRNDRACDDESVRFFRKEGSDGTVADVFILDRTSAEVRVTLGDEEVYAGTVSAEPGSRVPQEGTGDDCSDPCYRTTASLDLRDIGP